MSRNISDIVSYDLNGDGNLDIITAGAGGPLTVSLGNGDGTFQTGVTYASVANNRGIALNDYNNDGIMDMAVTASTDSTISIFFGNGDGSFQGRLSFSMGANYAFYLESADVNGDGIADLVGTDNTGAAMNIWLGNGNGTFRAPTSLMTSATSTNDSKNPTLADVNGDGIIDILVTNIDDNSAYLFLGNGNGTFQTRTALVSGAMSDPLSFAVGDINNDGIKDLVLGGNNAVVTFLGNGNGTFRTFASYASANITNINLVDLNNDGQLDIVGNTEFGTSIFTRFGNGNGSFGSVTTTATASSLTMINVGDYNNDGVIDIAGGNSSLMLYNAATSTSTNQEYLYLLDQAGARQSLTNLREYLTNITNELGSIGAYQSRLGIAANNLMIAKENFLSAESRIRDADIGSESAELVRKQILQQTATSILKQTSLAPRLALQLLQN